MQLAFIGGVAEAAAAYGYDMLLSPRTRTTTARSGG